MSAARIATVSSRGDASVAAYVARHWHSDVHGPFRVELLATPTADGPTVEARVNHGRWIADCITPHCAGAMYVEPDDPRYYCVYCLNPLADGKWLPVTFPDDRAAIEQALLERPVPATRNWEPGETSADLRRQNSDDGIGGTG